MRRSLPLLRLATPVLPRVGYTRALSISRSSTGSLVCGTSWTGSWDGGLGGGIRGGMRMFSASGKKGEMYLKPFLLADIGEGITECEIVKWMVEPDQVVEEFDPIVEVMSDKATVEITSPYAGRITNLAGNIGDIVKVGGVLCEVEMENADSPSELISTPSPPPTVYVDTLSPPTSTSTTTGSGGTEGEVMVKEEVVGSMTRERKLVHATPATRRLAKEASIDLSDVDGTGREGRVTKTDVMNFVANGNSNSNKVPPPPSTAAPATTQSTAILTEALAPIPLSPLRKAMFRAMTSTLQIPHFAYSETIDVTLLERLRLTLNANIPLRYRQNLTSAQEAELARLVEWGGEGRVALEERYERMTMLPLMIKAMSNAMSTNRLFLSSLSPSTGVATEERLLLPRSTHDISIALSAPSGGLFTPLLSSVDKFSPYKIASQIAHLQQISLASSPPKFPAQFKGNGTITLSNVGVVGGRTTSPIIPPTGQLAIGALGRARIVPNYARSSMMAAKAMAVSGEEGELEELKVVPRLMLDVTFCADHRVVEGVELARLVEEWKRILEEPSRLVGI